VEEKLDADGHLHDLDDLDDLDDLEGQIWKLQQRYSQTGEQRSRLEAPGLTTLRQAAYSQPPQVRERRKLKSGIVRIQ